MLRLANKVSWLQKSIKCAIDTIARIGAPLGSSSALRFWRQLPKWFFWVKFIVFLLALALIGFLILCGAIYFACEYIFNGDVVIENRRVEAVRIHRVAVNGHRVLLYRRSGVIQSVELSKEIEILRPDSIRANATNIITVTASSASAPEPKKYICAIFVPPQWGDVGVYFEDRKGIRCHFWEFPG
jgi:hypothetical protein